MIEKIKSIIDEVKRGENLDLYLTILLAIIIAILSIIDVASQKILNAVMLTTLGLIAGALLSNRKSVSETTSAAQKLGLQVKNLRDELMHLGNHEPAIVRMEYPDLREAFKQAKSVKIIGASLSTSSVQYLSICEHFLNNGGNLQIMLCEPSSSILENLAYRAYRVRSPEIIGNSIHKSIELLSSLYELPNVSDTFNLKVIPYVPPFGIVLLENHDQTSQAYVKLMPFRVSTGNYPVIFIDQLIHSDWFVFFSQQFDNLWEVGKEVKEVHE
ncbi:hypothetical protein KDA00_05540 [Candidatus Saccharibacteria bacterium]|nr:hypothetical protein [Candidatus Saccharibacteria bacterium]